MADDKNGSFGVYLCHHTSLFHGAPLGLLPFVAEDVSNLLLDGSASGFHVATDLSSHIPFSRT